MRRTRVERHGKLFTLYKFPGKVKNAEEDGPQFASPSDPRLARVGRILPGASGSTRFRSTVVRLQG